MRNKKKIIILILFLAGLVMLIFTFRNKSSFNIATKIAPITATKSTPIAPSQQTRRINSVGTNTNNNAPVSIPPSSEWASSSNGLVTLESPVHNTSIKSGDFIIGKTSRSTIYYLLIDNNVGVISRGNLPINNGQFIGQIFFTNNSSQGKLQVFYPNASNGSEQDIVEINVNFRN